MSNLTLNNRLSKKIYQLIAESTEDCSDDCECVVCLIKQLQCRCGIATINKCYKCRHRLCIDCENIDNQHSLCSECFSTDY